LPLNERGLAPFASLLSSMLEGGSGSQTTINIDGVTVAPDSEIARIAEALYYALERKVQLARRAI
jgi:hypothetical protein